MACIPIMFIQKKNPHVILEGTLSCPSSCCRPLSPLRFCSRVKWTYRNNTGDRGKQQKSPPPLPQVEMPFHLRTAWLNTAHSFQTNTILQSTTSCTEIWYCIHLTHNVYSPSENVFHLIHPVLPACKRVWPFERLLVVWCLVGEQSSANYKGENPSEGLNVTALQLKTKISGSKISFKRVIIQFKTIQNSMDRTEPLFDASRKYPFKAQELPLPPFIRRLASCAVFPFLYSEKSYDTKEEKLKANLD